MAYIRDLDAAGIRPRTAVPEGAHPDDPKTFLRVVYNGKISTPVWRHMARVVKSRWGEDGRDLFEDWTRQSAQYDPDACDTAWQRVSARDLMPEQDAHSTLRALARLCCPALRARNPCAPLFDVPRYSEIREYDLNTHRLDLQKWLKSTQRDICDYLGGVALTHESTTRREADLRRTVYVKSGMGTGKTYSLAQFCLEFRDKRVLWLSSRRAYAKALHNDFQTWGVDIANYMDRPSSLARTIISLESMHRLEVEEPYDLVVLDESESILALAGGDTVTKHEKVEVSLRAFSRHMRDAKQVVAMEDVQGASLCAVDYGWCWSDIPDTPWADCPALYAGFQTHRLTLEKQKQYFKFAWRQLFSPHLSEADLQRTFDRDFSHGRKDATLRILAYQRCVTLHARREIDARREAGDKRSRERDEPLLVELQNMNMASLQLLHGMLTELGFIHTAHFAS